MVRHRKTGLFVTGEARRTAVPDTAELTITLAGDAANAGQALQNAAARVLALEQALRLLALKSAEYQRLGLTVAPLPVGAAYGAPTTTEMNVGAGACRGISVCTLRLPLSDIDKIWRVLEPVSGGAPQQQLFASVSFLVRDEKAVATATLEMAAQNALEKAKALASGAGASLGELVSLMEEILPLGGAGVTAAGLSWPMRVAEDLHAALAAITPQTFHARVHVIYSLRGSSRDPVTAGPAA